MALTLRDADVVPIRPGPAGATPAPDDGRGSLYRSVRDSAALASAIEPALAEGRSGDAIRAFHESTAAALSVLPDVPSLAAVVGAHQGSGSGAEDAEAAAEAEADPFDRAEIGRQRQFTGTRGRTLDPATAASGLVDDTARFPSAAYKRVREYLPSMLERSLDENRPGLTAAERAKASMSRLGDPDAFEEGP